MHRQPGKRVADLEYGVGPATRSAGVRCDGLVVGTPAGSTGYNLANGGPVMAWGVEGIAVSFIAPHSLMARSRFVVAPGDTLEGPEPFARSGSPSSTRVRRPSPACVLEPGEADRGPVRRRPGAPRAQIAEHDLLPAPTPEVRPARERALAGRRLPVERVRREPAGTPLRRCSHELRVENLLLMERAELRLGPGLNVLTGETGAGTARCSRTLSICCSADGREPGSCGRAPPRRTSRASSSLPAARVGRQRADPDRTPMRLVPRPARVARMGAPAPTCAAELRRSPTCARRRRRRLLSFYGQHEHRKLMLVDHRSSTCSTHICGASQL